MMWADQHLRPCTSGEVHGLDGAGQDTSEAVDWVVDTGAVIPVVERQVAASFAWTTAPAITAAPLQGAVAVTLDLCIHYDGDLGITHYVPRGEPVGVRADNLADSLLGMSALAYNGAHIHWHPAAQSGAIH